MAAVVKAVSLAPAHTFSKSNVDVIRLVAGIGVNGDTHSGVTVQHRSRVARDPSQPNLRQVHLIHAELIDELNGRGFAVAAGDMGENITTTGIGLLDLPTGTRLSIGETAIVEITGLRNPCGQLNDFQAGLMDAVFDHDAQGNLIRKAGVMGVVIAGGAIRSGDRIVATFPDGPHRPLKPV
jgi:MOSC domain-containing protein YiiM